MTSQAGTPGYVILLSSADSGTTWTPITDPSVGGASAATIDDLQAQALIAADTNTAIANGQLGFAVGQGCLYSPNATPTKLDSTAGSILIGGTDLAVAAQTAISTTIASLEHATLPKWVKVEIDSSGVTQFNQGTAATEPTMPATTANRVLVARLYVPSSATNTTHTVDTLLSTSNGLAKLLDARIVRTGPTPSAWQYDQNTWVFSSSTTGAGGGLITFTVTGVDATGYLKPGTKVSWNDGTNVPGYGVVATSSFSTNTTVTLVKQSDYVMANATIKYPRYSYAASPQGFPTWFNWSPTLSGWATGAPSAVSTCATDVTANTITKTAHGLTAGYRVKPTGLVNTTGITNGTAYFVVTANANDFQLATTFGGSAIDLTGSNDAAVVTITPQAGADPAGVLVYKWKTDGRSITCVLSQQSAGTSSNAQRTITLPVASITLSGMRWNSVIDSTDNGVGQASVLVQGSASTTAFISPVSAGGGLTSNVPSGTSNIHGFMFYEF